MERITSRLAVAVVTAGVTVLAVGCGAAPAGGHRNSAAAASPALPNPFTITARYSAKSLGLDHPEPSRPARTATCTSPISASGSP